MRAPVFAEAPKSISSRAPIDGQCSWTCLRTRLGSSGRSCCHIPSPCQSSADSSSTRTAPSDGAAGGTRDVQVLGPARSKPTARGTAHGRMTGFAKLGPVAQIAAWHFARGGLSHKSVTNQSQTSRKYSHKLAFPWFCNYFAHSAHRITTLTFCFLPLRAQMGEIHKKPRKVNL